MLDSPLRPLTPLSWSIPSAESCDSLQQDVPAPEASTSSQPSATKPEQQLSQAGSNASSTCSSPSQQAKRSPAKASSLPKQHYLTSLQDGTVIFTDYEVAAILL